MNNANVFVLITALTALRVGIGASFDGQMLLGGSGMSDPLVAQRSRE